jgi:hypothetical protein
MTDPAHDTTFKPRHEPPPRFLHRFLDDEPHAALVHRVAVQVLVNEIVGTKPEASEPRSPWAKRRWRLEQQRWGELSARAERAQKNFWDSLS